MKKRSAFIILFANLILALIFSSCENTFIYLHGVIVTYKTDRGSTPKSIRLKEGTVLTENLLPELQEYGYEFEGWYYNGSKIEAGTYTVNEDMTLEAEWEVLGSATATPTFSVAAGAVDSGTSVTISSSTEGAVIYYTTDGSTPTIYSTRYSGAISITEAVTIKAIAVADGYSNSSVASASYTIKGVASTPTFSVASGAVDNGTSVTISCSTEGAVIYYTTDGSTPSTSSTRYSGAISLTEAVTIKAIAVADGYSNSSVASVSYTIKMNYGFVSILGATVTGAVTGSSVFRTGRTVTIPDMYVSDHEVTQKEYETYCNYGGSSPSSTYGDGDNYPAYKVSWYDAIVYCNLRSIDEGLTPAYSIEGETNPANWTGIVSSDGKYCGPASTNSTWDSITYNTEANGYRLPTEAEWEYIARGGNNGIPENQTTYSGSDTIDDVAWYEENAEDVGSSSSDYGSHEVKTKAANSLGIYDMSGNVFEWCWDWHGSISSTTPATGASSGSYRLLRGGSWGISAGSCSVSSRYFNYPYNRNYNNGFRFVRSAQ
ncbi:MAG: SUMF1/EgtB/PvdO family nonheme iron enzyme [Treponema sp.]|nr:SUMF1/EgtB/PvdO family nonheme iron enzyme [Treponema sp.]